MSDKFYTKDPKKAYIRTIEEIDYSIGQVLKTLRGLASMTIHSSSSRATMARGISNYAITAARRSVTWCKISTWEGGMRVPTIMRWPGKIPAGSDCGEVAAACDILPTFARLAKPNFPSAR
ncbi:MAG: hypothetical protein CM1200mP29_14850 [Verrucomicrobiota bacterium]|nr:MAG: hypothetical protein CM1200mP29_14850 [Verrucomicrobiota bacterium]